MARAATALLLVTGCSRVFGISHLDALADAPCPGHDEDGDCVPDLLDACPFVANATGDQDSDGVPDACDPFPAVPGDTLALFDGFATQDPVWSAVGGTWTFGGDNLVYTEMGMSNIQRPIMPGSRRVSVETELTMTGGVTGAFTGSFVSFTDHAMFCVVARGAPDMLEVIEDGVVMASTALFGTGPIRLRLVQLPDKTFVCSGARPNAAAVEITGPSVDEAARMLGFGASGAAVELAWAAVYTQP